MAGLQHKDARGRSDKRPLSGWLRLALAVSLEDLGIIHREPTTLPILQDSPYIAEAATYGDAQKSHAAWWVWLDEGKKQPLEF